MAVELGSGGVDMDVEVGSTWGLPWLDGGAYGDVERGSGTLLWATTWLWHKCLRLLILIAFKQSRHFR